MERTVNFRKVIAVISSVMMAVSMILNVSAEGMTYCTLTYLAGDVDNLVGATEVNFQKIINTTFDAAAASRFSRKGYYIKSWNVPSTGETVRTGAQYKMPDHDITFVANWEPQTYSVTFTGKGGKTAEGSANFYVDATYGTAMILPENQFIYDGYTFKGWKYDGVTYNAGDEFEIPALISGSKIVLSAVWEKGSSLTTTPAVTTVSIPTTTTTTATTSAVQKETTIAATVSSSIKTVSTVSVVTGETVVKNFLIGEQLDYSDNVKKMYHVQLADILSVGQIDKFEINISSKGGNIGSIVAGIGTVIDGEWYQIDYNETINSSEYTIDFADSEICNKMNSGSVQIGYWWGNVNPLYIDSITVTYKPQEIVVTVPVTTGASTATECTTEVTSFAVTTEAATVLTTESITEVNTTATDLPVITTTVTTLKESQYSKVVSINGILSPNNKNKTLTLNSDELISENQIIESIQLTFKTISQDVNRYQMSIGMATKDNGWEQFNFNGTCDSNKMVISAVIPEESQAYVEADKFLEVGYWWGDNENLILESIRVNYRIDCGDYNNDGVVGKDDLDALRKYMVGVSVKGYEINAKTADVNHDGDVNVFDYMYLSRLLQ